jgi:ParB/RepB/Spo0J family partition protein
MEETLRIKDIYVGNRTRSLNQERVEDIAKSIKEVGLLQPITIRVIEEFEDADGELWHNMPVLVTGHHRLEALKRLGRKEVTVQVLEVDDIDAERAEIAENLHRAELTALERDVQINRWIELTDAKLKEAGISGQSVQKIGRGRPEGAISAASRDLNVDRKDAARATKVASLSPEAQEAARRLRLDDNRTALLEAARKDTAEEQVVALEQFDQAKKQREKEREEARKAVPAAQPEPVTQPLDLAPAEEPVEEPESTDEEVEIPMGLEAMKQGFLCLDRRERHVFLFWAEIEMEAAA